ncbi:MAG: ATP-dependent RecD-like DNA helicase [Clostridia bacterium]|nr:ATP-dependent RecD-like DNA helicase [Clostridia bacterium]
MEEEISGIVEEIIYQNSENGYTICEIDSCDEGFFTAVGYMPFLSAGESVHLSGSWVTHASYGEQFKVSYYEKILPTDEQALLTYLSSGIISGIRQTTAKKLIEKFGTNVLNIMLTEPKRLSEIKGITEKKALKIGKDFAELQCMQSLVMFLQQYHISPNMAAKVYKILGSNALDLIKENPYVLSDRIEGISFKTADSIAFIRGIPKNSPYRIRSGIKYILTNAAYAGGHTYMPKTILVNSAAQALSVAETEIENGLSSLMLNKDIFVDIIDGIEACYLSHFYFSELTLARKLIDMSKYDQLFTMTIEEASNAIKMVEEESSIILAPEQKDAVFCAMKSAVMILTGGPGTGKTTTINTIIKLMKKLSLSVALAAPTGRAAKRMTEMTGLEAKTIHRLLKISFGQNEQIFEHDESNPLDADVIIVDEMSMVDISLMCALIKAIKPGARLIMSGDADQLPSVGPGNVLRDIINSKIVPVIRLNHIFRQAEQSLIIVNAHKINRGERPLLTQRNNNFFFLARHNANEIAETVVDLCKHRLPKSYNLDPVSDLQVLSPMKKGCTGVINLNVELQKSLNPPSDAKQEYQYGSLLFREGDKVMQTKNDYDLVWTRTSDNESGTGIFNGDMGIIQKIDTKNKSMTVIFDNEKIVEYEFSRLDELDLSYAITVHKSQGNEFGVVVMPVYDFAPMLMCRNLLYTAVTRAKDIVVLVGRETAVYHMVDNNTQRERFTGLCERLTKVCRIFESNPFL